MDLFLKTQGPLPNLKDFRGLALLDLSIEGYLSPAKPPFADFRKVLNAGAASIGRDACLSVSVGFEERESRQTADAHDRLAIEVRKGRWFFFYSANGSKVMADRGYALTFMQRLVAEAGLPLVINGLPNQQYTLRHRNQGGLWLSDCVGGEKISPATFSCELPDLAIDEMVNRLERAVSAAAGGKHFCYSWSAFNGEGLPLEAAHNAELYNAVSDAALPAEQLAISMTLRISEMEVLDWIKGLCGPRDKCYTSIGHLALPDDEYLNIDVVTTAKGHSIDLEASVPLDAATLSSQMEMQVTES